MWFVFTTTLVWHMFSVSFTSFQPWLFILGLQRMSKGSITTVYISGLGFFSMSFPLVSLTCLHACYQFPSFAFDREPPVADWRRTECDTKWTDPEKRKRHRELTRQPHKLHTVNCDGSTSHQPAPERRTVVSQCSLQNQQERQKPSKSKLRHKSELLWPNPSSDNEQD